MNEQGQGINTTSSDSVFSSLVLVVSVAAVDWDREQAVPTVTVLSADELGKRIAGLFEHSAFRLELLDYYFATNEREPLARFQAGQPQDLGWREPWKGLVTAARQAGKRMERVHVVTEPLSEYLRFELTCAYPTNVQAGEDVRVLPRRCASALDLPDHDYWLFDSRRAGRMTYDPDGNLLRIELVDDPDVIVRYCYGRDVALHYAVPLTAYLDTLDADPEVEVQPVDSVEGDTRDER